MSSKVQICNLALAMLGAARITSLSDNTTEAKLCNTLFDDLADEVMIESPWASTVRRAVLAQTTNDPTYGFDEEYQLPTNPFCLRVLSINNEAAGVIPFSIESDKLLISADAVSIKYIARITDTQSYGTALTRAMVARLAAELAYPITGSAAVSSQMYEKYEFILRRMLAIDGKQGSAEIITATTLTDIR